MERLLTEEELKKLTSTDGIIELLCDIPNFNANSYEELSSEEKDLIDYTMNINLITNSQIDGNLRKSMDAGNLALINQRKLTALSLLYFGIKDENGKYVRYTCPYTGKEYNLDEVNHAIKVLKENGAGEITLLHCTTEYPAPFEDVNLKAMDTIKEATGLNVGYSDHTKGIEVPVAAVALGACVIEKHFTLDRNMEGPDHKASIEPHELKQMVSSIRNIEKVVGDGRKVVSASELKNQAIARKSIIALTDIKKGDVFTEENITTKRPGNGINPMKWFDLLGRVAKHDYSEDYLIEKDELED